MSGHSKWAQIRRSKGVNDARRGQLFTRLGREIVVAVREGGSGDPNANFRLRMAVQRARDANMPMDNIERTIKRALGGAEGNALEEITYEGYRSEEHTSELQSRRDLVCRLLLEKKK